MKRKYNLIAAAAVLALTCGCSQEKSLATTPTETTSATEQPAAASKPLTETTVTTTTEEPTTTATETIAEEETTTAASEITTIAASASVTSAEATAVTTTTATATTTAATTMAETTTEETAAETTVTTTEETTTEVTAEPPEIIPESGIYTSHDGALYIDGKAYNLTFEDEFEGGSLDLTKWEYCPEWKRQDLECYWDNDCVTVKDGNLTLTAEQRGNAYYMGAVRSKGKFEQAYGYFEVKCTLNTIPGYWTAFWLMGETVGNENGSGVDGTEIDIMESAYFGKGINHALHWDGYGANHRSTGSQTENSSVYDGEYHTFALLWTESEYVFYIDGEECWRTSAEEAGGICQAPLYLKFTAETGSWTAAELNTDSFPDYVFVDYIRVYEKQN